MQKQTLRFVFMWKIRNQSIRLVKIMIGTIDRTVDTDFGVLAVNIFKILDMNELRIWKKMMIFGK